MKIIAIGLPLVLAGVALYVFGVAAFAPFGLGVCAAAAFEQFWPAP